MQFITSLNASVKHFELPCVWIVLYKKLALPLWSDTMKVYWCYELLKCSCVVLLWCRKLSISQDIGENKWNTEISQYP